MIEKGPRKRPEETEKTEKCPTTSFVVITEKGTYYSFSPTDFHTTFGLSGNRQRLKPSRIANTFANPYLECLAIPRPAKNVHSESHTAVPSTREEFYRIREGALEPNSKTVPGKVFSMRGWESKEGWDTPASPHQPFR